MNKFFKYYNFDLEEYKTDIKNIHNWIDEVIIKKLYKGISVIKLLNIFIDNIYSNLCDEKRSTLRRKIIRHSNRVYKNMKTIVSFYEITTHDYLSEEDKFVLTIACMLHDIGKVYSDDNHNLFSTVIVEYLLSMDGRFDRDLINKILEVIYFHSNKTKRKNKISLLAKILRDADLFDENCGFSLDILLISKIVNEKSNLNKLKIKEAKMMLYEKTNDGQKEDIKRKINVPGCYELYEQLLRQSKENFYLFIDEFEEYDDENDYYEQELEFIDYLRINID